MLCKRSNTDTHHTVASGESTSPASRQRHPVWEKWGGLQGRAAFCSQSAVRGRQEDITSPSQTTNHLWITFTTIPFTTHITCLPFALHCGLHLRHRSFRRSEMAEPKKPKQWDCTSARINILLYNWQRFLSFFCEIKYSHGKKLWLTWFTRLS